VLYGFWILGAVIFLESNFQLYVGKSTGMERWYVWPDVERGAQCFVGGVLCGVDREKCMSKRACSHHLLVELLKTNLSCVEN
jgi:hypothetical protein